MRSLPENSAANRSGSGCPASDSAASRSPAAQPSVRSYNRASAESESGIPAAANSARASSRVKRRSSARISVSSPSSRNRCRPSRRSRRVASTNRSPAGARISSSSSWRSASAERSSCTSSTTSQNPVLEPAQIGQQPLDDRPAIQTGSRRQRPHQLRPGRRVPQRAEHRQPEPLRVALLALHRYPRRPLRQAALADPRAQQKRLPASRRRRQRGHAPRPAEQPKKPGPGDNPVPDLWSSRSAGGPGPAGRPHGALLGRPRPLPYVLSAQRPAYLGLRVAAGSHPGHFLPPGTITRPCDVGSPSRT